MSPEWTWVCGRVLRVTQLRKGFDFRLTDWGFQWVQVAVKVKRWHKGGQPLSNPFRSMQLLGPSPFISTGWITKDEHNVMHVRTATISRTLMRMRHIWNFVRSMMAAVDGARGEG